jgi:hypothetical protein
MTVYTSTAGLNGGAYLALTVTEISQNIPGVSSVDSYNLTLVGGTFTSYDLTNTATWSVTINGVTTSGTFNYDFRPGPGTPALCTSGTTSSIAHNADGTKSISVSGSIGALPSGSTGGPATAAGTFVQTPIGVTTGAVVSRLSHTLTLPREDLVTTTTESGLITAISAAAPELILATLPTLSSVPVAAGTYENVLDALNEVVRTEQGAVYAATSGTLLAPTQAIVIRERTRPLTPTYSFDLEREISGSPDFVRDITNMVSSVTVNGPTRSATVTDITLKTRVGSKNTSESVALTDPVDLQMWGQDRLNRGGNVAIRVVSFTVDCMTTPTDRSADLLALVVGDRISITNLPSAQLGISSADGWVVSVSETHSTTEHSFTISMQPALPNTAIFDTNRAMSDGNMSVFADITSVATTVKVTTNDLTVRLEATTFPYTLLIGTEQVSVTAVLAATETDPQIATITRGFGGTTAAAHLAGSSVEIAVDSLYAY